MSMAPHEQVGISRQQVGYKHNNTVYWCAICYHPRRCLMYLLQFICIIINVFQPCYSTFCYSCLPCQVQRGPCNVSLSKAKVLAQLKAMDNLWQPRPTAYEIEGGTPWANERLPDNVYSQQPNWRLSVFILYCLQQTLRLKRILGKYGLRPSR